ncbi:MAG TPA: hypothetical protein VF611_15295, partial [Pyrinomonadaceae bacterium]
RTLLPFVLFAALCAAAAAPGAGAQTAAPRAEPTASEKSLAEGSREAIIKTGTSGAYFDRHFRLARVFDRPGDRRVVWTFSVGGYEATVSDSVGFYTEGGRRFDTHSVAGTLNSTSDLTRTIPRPRAERIMRRCMGGRFTNPQVEYRAHGPDGVAALLLTAENVVNPPGAGAGQARKEGEERAEREAALRREAAEQERDVAGRSRGKGKRPVVLLGAVDLSTGKCTVGRGQAGAPVAP